MTVSVLSTLVAADRIDCWVAMLKSAELEAVMPWRASRVVSASW